MKIGISLPNNWGVIDPTTLVDIAILAEQLGFNSVWTAEHLVNVSYVRDRIGDRPFHHPLPILSYIAARTTSIRLGTSILVLPFHHPFDLAKYLATLDHLSGGRVVLGVGTGNVPEEFAAMNIDWTKRGKITDETIDVLKVLWSQQPASYTGENWEFADVRTSPKCHQLPHIPIWVGGTSTAAFRRAVRVGAGWHPAGISVAEFREQRAVVEQMLDESGRDRAGFEYCMRFNIDFDGAMTEIERRVSISSGDVAQVRSRAEQCAEAGATHLILAINSNDFDAVEKCLTRIAGEVLSNVA